MACKHPNDDDIGTKNEHHYALKMDALSKGTHSIQHSLVEPKDQNTGDEVQYALTMDVLGKGADIIQNSLVQPKNHSAGGEVQYALTMDALSRGTDIIHNSLRQPKDQHTGDEVQYALTRDALDKRTDNIQSHFVQPKYQSIRDEDPYALTMDALSKETDNIQSHFVQPKYQSIRDEVPYALTMDALSKGKRQQVKQTIRNVPENEESHDQNRKSSSLPNNALGEEKGQQQKKLAGVDFLHHRHRSVSHIDKMKRMYENSDLEISPRMSTLASNVLQFELGGNSKSKKILYRCDLKTKIKEVRFRTGVDLDGKEIFMERVSRKRFSVVVFDMNGGIKRTINCNELEKTWDVKISDNLLYVCGVSMNKKIVFMMDKNGFVKSRIELPFQEKGGIMGAIGLAINGISKDIYVCSALTHTVYKCPHGSDNFKQFITRGLSLPTYICVDPWHGIVVSNTLSHTVCKYSHEGELMWSYGGQGSSNGQLNKPYGVCADPWGNIYVADKRNNRVVHISSDGEFLSNINVGETIEQPLAIAFRNYKLIISTGLRGYRVKDNALYVVNCLFE